MIKGILEYELFYCNHLGVSPSDEQDIMTLLSKTLKQDTVCLIISSISLFLRKMQAL